MNSRYQHSCFWATIGAQRQPHNVGSGLDPSVEASQRLFKSLELLDLKERERFGAASDFPGVYGSGSGLVLALHVPCEIALLSSPVLAHGACEWFVSCVDAHVHCEMALVSCPVRASRTFVPFARNLGFCKNKLPDAHY